MKKEHVLHVTVYVDGVLQTREIVINKEQFLETYLKLILDIAATNGKFCIGKYYNPEDMDYYDNMYGENLIAVFIDKFLPETEDGFEKIESIKIIERNIIETLTLV